MIRILINEETLIDSLIERLKTWTQDRDVISLYQTMYEDYVYNGVFEEQEVDVMAIVDNDYINYCSILSKEDCIKRDWDKLIKLYEEGQRDISCETSNHSYFKNLDRYSFIEAMNEDKTIALLRW